MLSPLALPRLPNDEVINTKIMSSAFVFKLKQNDVLVLTIIIIVLVQFSPKSFFFSVHGCKGR